MPPSVTSPLLSVPIPTGNIKHSTCLKGFFAIVASRHDTRLSMIHTSFVAVGCLALDFNVGAFCSLVYGAKQQNVREW